MAVAVRQPMTERDTRRAMLEPWRCDGKLDDGSLCRKVLMELDMARPSFIRKICEKCRAVNIWVESR